MNQIKTFLSIIFVLFYSGFSINTSAQSAQEEYSFRFEEINKRGMIALGSWGVGNIITSGSILLSGKPTGDNIYFHRMNIYWNTVNIGLAGISLLRAGKSGMQGRSLAEINREQKKTENIFLFNTGLDVAYIVGGLYLRELSATSENNKDLLKGFGNSIILQGGFLFVFDIIMYAFHNNNSRKLDPLLNSIQIGFNQASVNFRF